MRSRQLPDSALEPTQRLANWTTWIAAGLVLVSVLLGAVWTLA